MISNVILSYNGMVVENERTSFCGPPTDDRHPRPYEAALAVNRAGFAQLTAGNPVREVDRAACAAIEAAGYAEHVFHRTGHGIGMKGHGYPDDMACLDRPLLAREVYSREPGIYVHGLGGHRIDDTEIVGVEPEAVLATPRDFERAVAA